MKQTIIALIALLVIIGGWVAYENLSTPSEVTIPDNEQPMPVEPDGGIGDGAGPIPVEQEFETTTSLDTSAGGNEITAFHYGTGDTELLFVGGTHGGYSWNTALLSFELMDYLEENPDVIPENVMVTVIPVLNPDGLEEVVGTTGRFAQGDVPLEEEERIPGRFNANGVDLNRNFDCTWRSEGVWRSTTVDGGDEPFSEPESSAVRDYVLRNDVDAAVVFYSAAGGVFASECGAGVLPETREITNIYADASGYSAFEEFDFYEITGDMVNWLAKNNIPAISVLLTTHEDIELSKNLRGVEALLNYYAE